jgi:hypothetical protein
MIELKERLKIIQALLPVSQISNSDSEMTHVKNSQIALLISKYQANIRRYVSNEQTKASLDENSNMESDFLRILEIRSKIPNHI